MFHKVLWSVVHNAANQTRNTPDKCMLRVISRVLQHTRPTALRPIRRTQESRFWIEPTIRNTELESGALNTRHFLFVNIWDLRHCMARYQYLVCGNTMCVSIGVYSQESFLFVVIIISIYFYNLFALLSQTAIICLIFCLPKESTESKSVRVSYMHPMFDFRCVVVIETNIDRWFHVCPHLYFGLIIIHGVRSWYSSVFLRVHIRELPLSKCRQGSP